MLRPGADLYNGGNVEAEIAALNSGEARYSDYMRSGLLGKPMTCIVKSVFP